jgi:hypothetical protein
MKRRVPNILIELLEFWLSNCWSCIKWGSVFSDMFIIETGVRQGSVLSPFLFAIYINDLINLPKIGFEVYTILYADDILLLASSVYVLQMMFNICEKELIWLDMSINVKKSGCLRIGPRCDKNCIDIKTSTGCVIPWVKEIKYLGIYIVRSRNFKCSWDHAKKCFYRSLNAIFGRVGRAASEEVVLHLVNSKCIPVLLYGVDACPLTKSDISSMDFAINRFMMKLFKTNRMEIIRDCCLFFDIALPSELIEKRKQKFRCKYLNCNNILCAIFS